LSSASKLGMPAPALALPPVDPAPELELMPADPPAPDEDEDEAPGALEPGVPAPVPELLCPRAVSGMAAAAASAIAVR
jgi:hypothetical protein